MFIPHGTDAPIYHVPAVTITVIVLNVAIFFAPPVVEHFKHPDPATHRHRLPVLSWLAEGGYSGPDQYKLQFGEGIKPWQGITASFLHGSSLHLLSNMVFLLLFGIIVEGKIGWWKFLPIYFGIALVRGILLQTLVMIFNPGLHTAAIGASGLVFAVMAIALIWAPLNNIVITFAGLRYRTHHELENMDVPVYAMAGIFIFLDLLASYFIVQGSHGFVPYTSVLHTSGALLGAAVGIAMVHWKLVDCENFDVFSVWAGRHELTREQLEEESEAKTEMKLVQQGLQQIRQILDEGENPQLAYRAHASMAEKYASWHLPEREFLTLIKQLCDQKRDHDAVLAMEDYLKASRPKQNQVRLKLASLLTGSMQLPGQALSILLPIHHEELSAKEQAIYDKIAKEAKSQQASGVVDSPLDDW